MKPHSISIFFVILNPKREDMEEARASVLPSLLVESVGRFGYSWVGHQNTFLPGLLAHWNRAMREYAPEELLGLLNEVEKKNAPKRLFVEGKRELLEAGPRVSVVGSRKASKEGVQRVASLVRQLVSNGVVVVSGLAEGIDTVAHETAIQEKGHTIAVLGTPLDKVFPAKNRALQELIMREHLAISQFPSGHPSFPKNFPMRNRTMALIADSTVIVEAGEKSGTLHQGWEALRLGRPLFLMESLAQNQALTWPKELIRYGAQVLSRESLELLFELLPERSGGYPSALAL